MDFSVNGDFLKKNAIITFLKIFYDGIVAECMEYLYS